MRLTSETNPYSLDQKHQISLFVEIRGRARSWLRQYATSLKIVWSIPDEVAEFFFFNLPNPSIRTMALDWLSL
jgi:hypothetical protein